MSRSRGEDEPPDPEIETIRNRWDKAWHLRQVWVGLFSVLLAPLVLAAVIAVWTHGGLVVRVIGVAVALLAPVSIIAFSLGRKFGYRHGIKVKMEDETRKHEAPYDREHDEPNDRQKGDT